MKKEKLLKIQAKKEGKVWVIMDSTGGYPQEKKPHPTKASAVKDMELIWPINSAWHTRWIGQTAFVDIS